ncbi:MAG: LiaF-related protein [Spirochaetaceae bacterium]|nr:LiaF-related protein [Spirochaetaceae bacterium]
MEKNGSSSLDDIRQKALDVITSAFAQDRITIEEYEIRADKIQKAMEVDTIEAQVADLPRSRMPREAPETGTVSKQRESSTRDFRTGQKDEPSDFIACVMGERMMTGDWLNSDSVISITLMGDTIIDLRDTSLPPHGLKIQAFAVMGEIKIIVPEGLPVRMSAVPFMGEAHLHKSVTQRADPDGPWVEISGLAFMGSINVKAL